MFEYSKYIEVLSGIITTVLSIVKSELLINKMGIEKFGLMIIILIIMTLIMLSDSPKKDR